MKTQTRHLTDEQWAATLSDGVADAGIEQHLRDCVRCRAEQQQLQRVVEQMRGQITAVADRPAAFWDWQLQTTVRALPQRRRVRLLPALAGTLALVALALLLLQRPPTIDMPGSQSQAAVFPVPAAGGSEVTSAAAAGGALMSDDAALMAEVSRMLQAPPPALQPAALLAQELLSAPIASGPGNRSKGEIQ
jgi:hypothetical protein